MKKLIFFLLFIISCFVSLQAENYVNFDDIKTKNIKSAEGYNWVQFGPGMSGNNKCAFWHPTLPSYLYIAPNMGNSYRSIDGGKNYETIMDCDAPGYKERSRGPLNILDMDFSRQNAKLGMCTDDAGSGLWLTVDTGRTWSKISSSESVMDGYRLATVAVDPNDDNIWYVGAGSMSYSGRLNFTKALPHGEIIGKFSNPSGGKIWKTVDKGNSWSLINKGINSKAEATSMIVDPDDSNIVYLATNYGFYKSKDAGKIWSQKSEGLDNDCMRDLTTCKVKDKTYLYLLVNRMWKKAGSTVADSCGGIFVSVDKGESWINIDGDIAINVNSISDYSSQKHFYYVMANYFGETDEQIREDIKYLPYSLTYNFNTIDVDPNDPGNIYVSNMYENNSELNWSPGSLFRSKDGGDHWDVTFRNGKYWQDDSSNKDLAYWNSRKNPLGTNLDMRYLGDHWINRDNYDSKSCHFARFNCDGTILHTQFAKISFMSYDKGDTWKDIDDEYVNNDSSVIVGAGNSNVPGHGFYQSLLLPNKVFCCGGENSLWVTTDGGDEIRDNAQAAQVIFMKPGSEQSCSSIAIDPNDPDIMYALLFRQTQMGECLKSIDGGKTWNSISNSSTGIMPIPTPWPSLGGGDQSVHQLSFIIDKNDSKKMYFCVPKNTSNLEWVGQSVTGWGVHKSTDGGVTWSEIATADSQYPYSSPNKGLPESLDVARLVFSPSNDSIFACVTGKNGGLFVSTDDCEYWSEVESTKSIKGSYGINDIKFSADGKVYIASGYKTASANDGGLYVSDDNMKTFSKIFDFPWVNRVETAHWDPNTILISTLSNTSINYLNTGMYLSKDGGKNWIKINSGNGQSDRVNDIAIDNYVKGKYYCSTYGSGWYVMTDPNVFINSIKSLKKANDVKIVYKNSGGITISNLDNKKYISLEIYTIDGKKILKDNYSEILQSNKININTSMLKRGLYLIKLRLCGSTKYAKFMIK